MLYGIIILKFLWKMGWRYTVFRLFYWIMKKTGLLRLYFQKNDKSFLAEELYRYPLAILPHHNPGTTFPFQLPLPLPFPHLPQGNDWLWNAASGYLYDSNVHWTTLPDLNYQRGDIKEIWEKSRFCFLHTIIRHDFHHGTDSSRKVFNCIDHWIEHNPVNCGPNWICSQEIAIRLINWTFALCYYSESKSLSDKLRTRIFQSIHHQALHIAKNLIFAQIAVRNNHILTESLCLYIVGNGFPQFPESTRWKKKGKEIFEREIKFQINPDGAYLQHSMNYHRLVVQLLTLAISVARQIKDPWQPFVYQRALATYRFLRNFQDEVSGQLPNYGCNDGSLLFPLSSSSFADYRPQLGALAHVLDIPPDYSPGLWQEEGFWFTGKIPQVSTPKSDSLRLTSYPQSGYFSARTPTRMLFIRCGAYRQRPGQADNLHFDYWENGKNLVYDAGSYRYNTEKRYLDYYHGTEAHNTVKIGFYDQMQRGPRFMWAHWIRDAEGAWIQSDQKLIFQGAFKGFTHLIKDGITHCRRITTDRNLTNFEIYDHLDGKPLSLEMRQLWHVHPAFYNQFSISATDGNGHKLMPIFRQGWYSKRYGVKTDVTYFEFTTCTTEIITVFRRKTKNTDAILEYNTSISHLCRKMGD